MVISELQSSEVWSLTSWIYTTFSSIFVLISMMVFWPIWFHLYFRRANFPLLPNWPRVCSSTFCILCSYWSNWTAFPFPCRCACGWSCLRCCSLSFFQGCPRCAIRIWSLWFGVYFLCEEVGEELPYDVDVGIGLGELFPDGFVELVDELAMYH